MRHSRDMERAEIEARLREVGLELEQSGTTGEIVVVGGAYMTLVLRSREATKDVDAYLDPATSGAIRKAAATVASRHDLPEDWLNDAVKGFFATVPKTALWAEYPGLRVNTVTPAYMFAMKALAGRPADIEDLRILAQRMGVSSAHEALAIVTEHVPERLLTARTRYVVEALFEDGV